MAMYVYKTTVPIVITTEDAYRAGRSLGKSPLYFIHLMGSYTITLTPSPYYGA